MKIKDTIKKYIVFKIDGGHFNIGERIFSENQLAIKFDCTRQTARAALVELKNEFIIKPVQGSGYVVIDRFLSNNLRPFGLSNQITDTKIILFSEIPIAIKKALKIKEDEITTAFIKEFYQQQNLIAAQFTVLNKDHIWKLNYPKMKDSITKELANQGAPIVEANFQIYFKKYQVLEKYQSLLGWDNLPLIIQINSLSNNYWIEKSLRIEKKEHINISFSKKRFGN